MIASVAVRWLLTVMFLLPGLLCVYRCVAGRTLVGGVSDVLHMLMCLGMVMMTWPAWVGVASGVQVVLFCAASLWFAGLFLAGQRGPGHVHHALMMGAMAWMVAISSSGMPAMRGMPMRQPVHTVVIAGALAVVFLAGTVAWAARTVRAAVSDGQLVRFTFAANAMMSLGMGVMIATMI